MNSQKLASGSRVDRLLETHTPRELAELVTMLESKINPLQTRVNALEPVNLAAKLLVKHAQRPQEFGCVVQWQDLRNLDSAVKRAEGF